HPDDAELSAFGTFALMRHLGYEILLAHFTAGENTSAKPSTKRPAQAMESASLLNARCLTGPEPDGSIAYSAAAVAWADELIRRTKPSVVVTHYPQNGGFGHQDHVTVSEIVTNAALRNASVKTILH